MKNTKDQIATTFDETLECALRLDKEDSLAGFRNEFFIPFHKDGNPSIYFCGNSLGLQPKSVHVYIQQELDDWAKLGVEGHVHGKYPWLSYHELLTGPMARIVGAKPIEVVCVNTLTTNLHMLLASFYRPTKDRCKILIEGDAFPSDRYAVASQVKWHGYDPKEAIVIIKPREGEVLIDQQNLEKIIENEGDEIALIMLGGLNYYTGQFFDLKRITDLGHKHGCVVGFDLAHAAGNVELDLHESGADFAAWCSYKYLNSGPGSLAALFVHERHAYNFEVPRFAGWWGHNKTTRFNMRHDFDPLPGAEGWQLSNPPILSLAAVRASLDIFDRTTMSALRKKSMQLTAYLEYLLNNIDDDRIKIITPSNPDDRGCQLSIQMLNTDKRLYNMLTEKGVIADWREPDVIRVAPVPLYNTFQDVYRFAELMKSSLKKF
ncbi:MAG: kynureninase [Cyclobacteriaceae bacterium]|nr:kynureninase [Cyclobacteriaceae bacterium]